MKTKSTLRDVIIRGREDAFINNILHMYSIDRDSSISEMLIAMVIALSERNESLSNQLADALTSQRVVYIKGHYNEGVK